MANTASPPIDLKPEAWAWHLFGFVLPLTVVAGNLAGQLWTIAATVLVFVVYPVLDVVSGEARPARPPRENGRPFELFLLVHSLLNPLMIASLCYRIALDGNQWTLWTATLSTGVGTSVCGIVVGHELGHTRPGGVRWWLARFNLTLQLYSHFTVEHNHNHHRTVATKEDPVSAPRGRGLWVHILMAIPLQFVSAWRIENQRAVKAGRSAVFLRSPVFRWLVAQAVLVASLCWSLGGWVGLAFSGQAVVSIILLEYINYIRHYGLSREAGERQTEMHSWQTECRWSRWTLLELTRHPAHHLSASTPYWRLQPYSNAPRLPSGYYGVFWPCCIPPI